MGSKQVAVLEKWPLVKPRSTASYDGKIPKISPGANIFQRPWATLFK